MCVSCLLGWRGGELKRGNARLYCGGGRDVAQVGMKAAGLSCARVSPIPHSTYTPYIYYPARGCPPSLTLLTILTFTILREGVPHLSQLLL